MRIIESFTLRTDYGTPEEMVKQIELLKFTIGMMFRYYNKAAQMDLIGAIERVGGECNEIAEFLRQFTEQKDAAETTFSRY